MLWLLPGVALETWTVNIMKQYTNMQTWSILSDDSLRTSIFTSVAQNRTRRTLLYKIEHIQAQHGGTNTYVTPQPAPYIHVHIQAVAQHVLHSLAGLCFVFVNTCVAWSHLKEHVSDQASLGMWMVHAFPSIMQQQCGGEHVTTTRSQYRHAYNLCLSQIRYSLAG